MACRYGRTICPGGYGEDSGKSGTGVGIPLQTDGIESECACYCDQPVRRDSRYAGGASSCKGKGNDNLAIVNVVGSSIAREADKVFYTLAGPEISVATTKAYSAQLAAMYCIAVEFAFVRGKITEEQYAYYISELLTIVPKINKILEDKERLQWFAAKYAGAHDVFFVGRGIDYAVSLEAVLN